MSYLKYNQFAPGTPNAFQGQNGLLSVKTKRDHWRTPPNVEPESRFSLPGTSCGTHASSKERDVKLLNLPVSDYRPENHQTTSQRICSIPLKEETEHQPMDQCAFFRITQKETLSISAPESSTCAVFSASYGHQLSSTSSSSFNWLPQHEGTTEDFSKSPSDVPVRGTRTEPSYFGCNPQLAANILENYGLESADLDELLNYSEEQTTAENLPYLLQSIRVKKATRTASAIQSNYDSTSWPDASTSGTDARVSFGQAGILQDKMSSSTLQPIKVIKNTACTTETDATIGRNIQRTAVTFGNTLLTDNFQTSSQNKEGPLTSFTKTKSVGLGSSDDQKGSLVVPPPRIDQTRQLQNQPNQTIGMSRSTGFGQTEIPKDKRPKITIKPGQVFDCAYTGKSITDVKSVKNIDNIPGNGGKTLPMDSKEATQGSSAELKSSSLVSSEDQKVSDAGLKLLNVVACPRRNPAEKLGTQQNYMSQSVPTLPLQHKTRDATSSGGCKTQGQGSDITDPMLQKTNIQTILQILQALQPVVSSAPKPVSRSSFIPKMPEVSDAVLPSAVVSKNPVSSISQSQPIIKTDTTTQAPSFKSQYPAKTASSKDLPTLAMMFDFAGVTPRRFSYTCSLCKKKCAQLKDWVAHQVTDLHHTNCKRLRSQYPHWDGVVPSLQRDAVKSAKTLPPASPHCQQKNKRDSRSCSYSNNPSCSSSGDRGDRSVGRSRSHSYTPCHRISSEDRRHKSRSRSRHRKNRSSNSSRSYSPSHHSSRDKRNQSNSSSCQHRCRISRSCSCSPCYNRSARSSYRSRSRSYGKQSSPKRMNKKSISPRRNHARQLSRGRSRERQPSPRSGWKEASKRCLERQSSPRKTDDKRLSPIRRHIPQSSPRQTDNGRWSLRSARERRMSPRRTDDKRWSPTRSGEQLPSTRSDNRRWSPVMSHDQQSSPIQSDFKRRSQNRNCERQSFPRRTDDKRWSPMRSSMRQSSPRNVDDGLLRRSDDRLWSPLRSDDRQWSPQRSYEQQSSPRRIDNRRWSPMRKREQQSSSKNADIKQWSPAKTNAHRSPPRRADDKHRSPPRRADDKHRSPPRRADDKHRSPPRRADDKHRSPPRRADGKHRSPPRRADGKHRSPPRRADDKHRSPPRRADGKHRSPPRRADDKHRSPLRCHERQSSPRRNDDKRWSPTRKRERQSSPKITDDKHWSPTRSHDYQSSPGRTNDKQRSPIWSREYQRRTDKLQQLMSNETWDDDPRWLPKRSQRQQLFPETDEKQFLSKQSDKEMSSVRRSSKRHASLEEELSCQKKKTCSVQILTKQLLENSAVESMSQQSNIEDVVNLVVPVLLAELAKNQDSSPSSLALPSQDKRRMVLTHSSSGSKLPSSAKMQSKLKWNQARSSKKPKDSVSKTALSITTKGQRKHKLKAGVTNKLGSCESLDLLPIKTLLSLHQKLVSKAKRLSSKGTHISRSKAYSQKTQTLKSVVSLKEPLKPLVSMKVRNLETRPYLGLSSQRSGPTVFRKDQDFEATVKEKTRVKGVRRIIIAESNKGKKIVTKVKADASKTSASKQLDKTTKCSRVTKLIKVEDSQGEKQQTSNASQPELKETKPLVDKVVTTSDPPPAQETILKTQETSGKALLKVKLRMNPVSKKSKSLRKNPDSSSTRDKPTANVSKKGKNSQVAVQATTKVGKILKKTVADANKGREMVTKVKVSDSKTSTNKKVNETEDKKLKETAKCFSEDKGGKPSEMALVINTSKCDQPNCKKYETPHAMSVITSTLPVTENSPDDSGISKPGISETKVLQFNNSESQLLSSKEKEETSSEDIQVSIKIMSSENLPEVCQSLKTERSEIKVDKAAVLSEDTAQIVKANESTAEISKQTELNTDGSAIKSIETLKPGNTASVVPTKMDFPESKGDDATATNATPPKPEHAKPVSEEILINAVSQVQPKMVPNPDLAALTPKTNGKQLEVQLPFAGSSADAPLGVVQKTGGEEKNSHKDPALFETQKSRLQNPVGGAPVLSTTAADSAVTTSNIKTAATPNRIESLVTVGERIGYYLNLQNFNCVPAEIILSSKSYTLNSTLLLITNLPVKKSCSYTEEEVVNLLCKFEFQYAHDNIYVIPETGMAFVLMPDVQSVIGLVFASVHGHLSFKSQKLFFQIVETDMLMTPLGFYKSLIELTPLNMRDDGTSIIYIQNISPSDIADLRKALRRIGHVRNFLPLLNKVFVEFETVYDADRLGVWCSLMRMGCLYTVDRLKVPRSIKKSQPPKLPLKALPASAKILPNAGIPNVKYGIPQGTTAPCWVTMMTPPYVFPTVCPWFNVPNFVTVQGEKDILTTPRSGSEFFTVMLTGLPEGKYKHEDVAKLVWHYFPKQDLQTLYYNILVLPLQRRAFVFFCDWEACCSFVSDCVKKPVSVKNCTLSIHFVLEDMHPGFSEEIMYRTQMIWSSGYVPELFLLEKRLVCVEIYEANVNLIKSVLKEVATIASFVSFVPLGNRICIEMVSPSCAAKVLQEMPLRKVLSTRLWSKVGRVECMKDLSRRLKETSEIKINLEADTPVNGQPSALKTLVHFPFSEPRNDDVADAYPAVPAAFTISNSESKPEGRLAEPPDVVLDSKAETGSTTEERQPCKKISAAADPDEKIQTDPLYKAISSVSDLSTEPSVKTEATAEEVVKEQPAGVDSCLTAGEGKGSLLQPQKIRCLGHNIMKSPKLYIEMAESRGVNQVEERFAPEGCVQSLKQHLKDSSETKIDLELHTKDINEKTPATQSGPQPPPSNVPAETKHPVLEVTNLPNSVLSTENVPADGSGTQEKMEIGAAEAENVPSKVQRPISEKQPHVCGKVQESAVASRDKTETGSETAPEKKQKVETVEVTEVKGESSAEAKGGKTADEKRSPAKPTEALISTPSVKTQPSKPLTSPHQSPQTSVKASSSVQKCINPKPSSSTEDPKTKTNILGTSDAVKNSASKVSAPSAEIMPNTNSSAAGTSSQPFAATSSTEAFPLTPGEKLQHFLKPFKLCRLDINTILSPVIFSLNITLVITNLPMWFNGSYTEAEIINVLQKCRVQCEDNKIFIVPQSQMAFLIMPKVEEVQHLFTVSPWRNLFFKGRKLGFHVISSYTPMTLFRFYRYLMSFTDFLTSWKNCDTKNILYFQNVSTSEARDLREALRKIGKVINYLPLLNKVFVHCETPSVANRLGVWYSHWKLSRSHNGQQTGVPEIVNTSKSAHALQLCQSITVGASVPGTTDAIPQGSTAPFWITMTTSPYVVQTTSPFFKIPAFQTVNRNNYMEISRRDLKFAAVMLTGLPNRTYTHEDVAMLVWKHFPEQNLHTLYNNIVVLPLQRRVFVLFSSTCACLRFLQDQNRKPVFLKAVIPKIHLVLEDINLGSSEESMFRSLMKWSNIHVPELKSLEERLLIVEVSGTNDQIVMVVMKEVASIATFASFLPLANRIYIEMAESSGVIKVVEKLSVCKLSEQHEAWKQVGRVESLLSRKERLKDCRKIAVNLERGTMSLNTAATPLKRMEEDSATCNALLHKSLTTSHKSRKNPQIDLNTLNELKTVILQNKLEQSSTLTKEISSESGGIFKSSSSSKQTTKEIKISHSSSANRDIPKSIKDCKSITSTSGSTKSSLLSSSTSLSVKTQKGAPESTKSQTNPSSSVGGSKTFPSSSKSVWSSASSDEDKRETPLRALQTPSTGQSTGSPTTTAETPQSDKHGATLTGAAVEKVDHKVSAESCTAKTPSASRVETSNFVPTRGQNLKFTKQIQIQDCFKDETLEEGIESKEKESKMANSVKNPESYRITDSVAGQEDKQNYSTETPGTEKGQVLCRVGLHVSDDVGNKKQAFKKMERDAFLDLKDNANKEHLVTVKEEKHLVIDEGSKVKPDQSTKASLSKERETLPMKQESSDKHSETKTKDSSAETRERTMELVCKDSVLDESSAHMCVGKTNRGANQDETNVVPTVSQSGKDAAVEEKEIATDDHAASVQEEKPLVKDEGLAVKPDKKSRASESEDGKHSAKKQNLDKQPETQTKVSNTENEERTEKMVCEDSVQDKSCKKRSFRQFTRLAKQAKTNQNKVSTVVPTISKSGEDAAVEKTEITIDGHRSSVQEEKPLVKDEGLAVKPDRKTRGSQSEDGENSAKKQNLDKQPETQTKDSSAETGERTEEMVCEVSVQDKSDTRRSFRQTTRLANQDQTNQDKAAPSKTTITTRSTNRRTITERDSLDGRKDKTPRKRNTPARDSQQQCKEKSQKREETFVKYITPTICEHKSQEILADVDFRKTVEEEKEATTPRRGRPKKTAGLALVRKSTNGVKLESTGEQMMKRCAKEERREETSRDNIKGRLTRSSSAAVKTLVETNQSQEKEAKPTDANSEGKVTTERKSAKTAESKMEAPSVLDPPAWRCDLASKAETPNSRPEKGLRLSHSVGNEVRICSQSRTDASVQDKEIVTYGIAAVQEQEHLVKDEGLAVKPTQRTRVSKTEDGENSSKKRESSDKQPERQSKDSSAEMETEGTEEMICKDSVQDKSGTRQTTRLASQDKTNEAKAAISAPTTTRSISRRRKITATDSSNERKEDETPTRRRTPAGYSQQQNEEKTLKTEETLSSKNVTPMTWKQRPSQEISDDVNDFRKTCEEEKEAATLRRRGRPKKIVGPAPVRNKQKMKFSGPEPKRSRSRFAPVAAAVRGPPCKPLRPPRKVS